jgi:hypothetical protein
MFTLKSTGIIVLTVISNTGHVTRDEGKVYQLENTGHNNASVITRDRKDGHYIRPTSYYVEPAHVCNFYSESTRGVGYLIGEFHGAVGGYFGSHWAAFYECWGGNPESK